MTYEREPDFEVMRRYTYPARLEELSWTSRFDESLCNQLEVHVGTLQFLLGSVLVLLALLSVALCL